MCYYWYRSRRLDVARISKGRSVIFVYCSTAADTDLGNFRFFRFSYCCVRTYTDDVCVYVLNCKYNKNTKKTQQQKKKTGNIKFTAATYTYVYTERTYLKSRRISLA